MLTTIIAVAGQALFIFISFIFLVQEHDSTFYQHRLGMDKPLSPPGTNDGLSIQETIQRNFPIIAIAGEDPNLHIHVFFIGLSILTVLGLMCVVFRTPTKKPRMMELRMVAEEPVEMPTEESIYLKHDLVSVASESVCLSYSEVPCLVNEMATQIHRPESHTEFTHEIHQPQETTELNVHQAYCMMETIEELTTDEFPTIEFTDVVEQATLNKINWFTGDQIPGYNILETVFHGEFHKTLLAADERTQASCYVRVIDKSGKRRFQVKYKFSYDKSAQMEVMWLANTCRYCSQLVDFFENRSKLVCVIANHGADLQWFLQHNLPQIDEKLAIKIVAQLSCAVDFLHQQGVIHSFIHPSNIYINEKLHIRLGNFFRSIKRCNTRARGRWGYLGSYPYTAPELPRGDKYDQAIDWWCVGIITYLVIYGMLPFCDEHDSSDMMRERILNHDATFPPHRWVSNAAITLIQGLLHKNPLVRLGTVTSPAGSIFAQDAFKINGITFKHKKFSTVVHQKIYSEQHAVDLTKYHLPTPNNVVITHPPPVQEDAKTVTTAAARTIIVKKTHNGIIQGVSIERAPSIPSEA